MLSQMTQIQQRFLHKNFQGKLWITGRKTEKKKKTLDDSQGIELTVVTRNLTEVNINFQKINFIVTSPALMVEAEGSEVLFGF